MARGILLSLLLLSSLPAAAKERELGVHGGKPAYIRVRGVAQKGIKLQPGVAGWYLTLDVPGSGPHCNAELRDVSPLPPPLSKWIEEVPNVAQSSTVMLDPHRYLATHTYALTLKCGLRTVSQSLVHLLPPTDEKLQQKFDLAQKPTADEGNDDIVTVPKSAL